VADVYRLPYVQLSAVQPTYRYIPNLSILAGSSYVFRKSRRLHADIGASTSAQRMGLVSSAPELTYCRRETAVRRQKQCIGDEGKPTELRWIRSKSFGK